MLGRIIIRFLNVILNIAVIFIILGGCVYGANIATETGMPIVVGILIGLLGGIVVAALTLGVLFLLLEINNKLRQIRDLLRHDTDPKEIQVLHDEMKLSAEAMLGKLRSLQGSQAIASPELLDEAKKVRLNLRRAAQVTENTKHFDDLKELEYSIEEEESLHKKLIKSSK